MVDMMADKLWSRVITAFADDQGVQEPTRCEWDMEQLDTVAREHNGTIEGVTKFLNSLDGTYLEDICIGEQTEVDRLLAHAGTQAEAVHAVLDTIYDGWGDHEDD
jgi:hypothetical protein